MLEQGHELVAEVDEGHRLRPVAQPQLREQRAPEIKRLGDAADVESHMVDSDRTRH